LTFRVQGYRISRGAVGNRPALFEKQAATCPGENTLTKYSEIQPHTASKYEYFFFLLCSKWIPELIILLHRLYIFFVNL
jgi:hypothetical protein